MLYKKKNYRNMFLLSTLGIFVVLFTLSYALGLLPSEFQSANIEPPKNVEPNIEAVNVLNSQTRPISITISSVGINTKVFHPASPEVQVLDQALLSGAVYYPGSGTIENGNIFVFGHSTGLSVVQNQAFKTFNNLKKVQAGDEIEVKGEDGKTYIYKAISVDLVNDEEALVTFDTTSRMLTLSTCNTFGAKQERHVVKAKFDRIK